MKTTIEISDTLLIEAKKYAASRGLTLRQVMELGLQSVLKEPASKKRFRMKLVTFGGKGSKYEGNWEAIREMIYEGRGGIGETK